MMRMIMRLRLILNSFLDSLCCLLFNLWLTFEFYLWCFWRRRGLRLLEFILGDLCLLTHRWFRFSFFLLVFTLCCGLFYLFLGNLFGFALMGVFMMRQRLRSLSKFFVKKSFWVATLWDRVFLRFGSRGHGWC